MIITLVDGTLTASESLNGRNKTGIVHLETIELVASHHNGGYKETDEQM